MNKKCSTHHFYVGHQFLAWAIFCQTSVSCMTWKCPAWADFTRDTLSDVSKKFWRTLWDHLISRPFWVVVWEFSQEGDQILLILPTSMFLTLNSKRYLIFRKILIKFCKLFRQLNLALQKDKWILSSLGLFGYHYAITVNKGLAINGFSTTFTANRKQDKGDEYPCWFG